MIVEIPAGQTPIQAAARVYDGEYCARTFDEDLAQCLLSGYVFSTPSAFIMGYATRHDAPYETLTSPSRSLSLQKKDCWWVYLAAGKISEFFRFAPFKLDFVGWERDNQPVIHKFDEVRKRVRI